MPKTNPPANQRKAGAQAAARNTDSGPAHLPSDTGADLPAEKMAQVEALAVAMPHNPTKAAEHGFANAIAPQRGATVKPESRLPGGSTLTEENGSEKTGSVAPEGLNATIEPPSPTTRTRSSLACVAPPCWKTLCCGKNSPTSTMSVFPSVSCMRAVRLHTAFSKPTNR